MQIVKFPADFYDEGVVKFAAGDYYPLNSETQNLVNTGYAEMVNPETMQDDVEALQALAQFAKDRVTALEAWRAELVKEAEQAQQLVDIALMAKQEKTAPLPLLELSAVAPEPAAAAVDPTETEKTAESAPAKEEN